MLKVCDSNYCPNIAVAKAPTAPVLNTALHLHSNQILTNDFVEFRGQETFSLIDLFLSQLNFLNVEGPTKISDQLVLIHIIYIHGGKNGMEGISNAASMPSNI